MTRNEVVRHTTEWIKLYLQRRTWLYQAVMTWKSRRVPSLLVRKGRTRIVIEAFPRSSNSVSVRLFKQANPQIAPDDISHHSHVVSNVKHAVKWNIPALVVIRDPVDAIASNMLAAGDESDGMLRLLATKYTDFYSWVAQNLDRVVVAHFRDITRGRFKHVIEQLNHRFGAGFCLDFDEEKLMQSVMAEIKVASPNRANDSRIPIPSAERESRYESLRPRIRDAKSTCRAIEVYERIVASASLEP
jgi:hypothetical protein